MDVLVLIGRVLFALIFLGSAVAHLTKTQAMGAYAASRGVPAAVPATITSGLVILAGGLSIALGIWADLGALLLAAFAFTAAVLMHGFWREEDPQARQTEQTHFLKDTALGGAALMLIAFFSYVGDDLGLTITGPLFDIS
ncbi:DoxX family protein [Streptomyces sp. TBY4]|uniref:DoxX family protein n=1 Tax=Streptomyces sp. TBY4 TaxID=2962030 RepID=UPI0020B76EF8|nr:DoxX family membrane protein [Streptomyces sp. TBY4]MCP3757050.1 DoxX family membrane protein [Streptomyces sp. TBY4]